MTNDDMRGIFDTHAALYGTVSTPADGDDYTWGDTGNALVVSVDNTYRPTFDGVIDYGQHPESTQPWQEHISQRLTRLETELAELRAKVEGG